MRISDWSSDVCSSDLHRPRDRPARRQERPPSGLSDREPRHGRLSPSALRHLRGDRPPSRWPHPQRRRQPRHPPQLRSAQGIARTAFLRLRRRPLRAGDRRRLPRLPPRRGEIRHYGGAEGADRGGLRRGEGAAGRPLIASNSLVTPDLIRGPARQWLKSGTPDQVRGDEGLETVSLSARKTALRAATMTTTPDHSDTYFLTTPDLTTE